MKDHKPVKSPPMQTEAPAGKTNSGLNREIQAKIGQQLRAMFDEVVQEGVPDRFASLLRQLDTPPEKTAETPGTSKDEGRSG
jgi:anti-sigma factor NepR-like protein